MSTLRAHRCLPLLLMVLVAATPAVAFAKSTKAGAGKSASSHAKNGAKATGKHAAHRADDKSHKSGSHKSGQKPHPNDARHDDKKSAHRAGKRTDDASEDKPLTAKEKKKQAKEQAALRKECADKKAAKSKKCKRFFLDEQDRATAAEQAKLEEKCKDKKERKSKACKAILGKSSKAEADPCGRKYGRTRAKDTVAKFAKRYGVAESTVRKLNDLDDAVKKLKAGKRLLVAKSPHDGVTLSGGVPLPEAPNYLLRRPYNAFGKPLLVDTLRAAAATVQAQNPLVPRLVIGDLSKEGGGCLPPHKSHRGGLDADVGYYFRGGREPKVLADATGSTIDADRTWQLLKAILATGRVQYAFVHYRLQPAIYDAAVRAGESAEDLARWIQYPRPIEHVHVAPIRHLDGHDDHFHLRLRCDGDDCTLAQAALDKVMATRIEALGGPVAEQRGRLGMRQGAILQSMR